jgi:peptidoglycan hydrolase CwlO-like protein
VSQSVHANPEDLRRLQKAVDTAQAEVSDALKKLQRAFASADWKDAARNDFEAKLNSATASVRQTTQRLDELKPVLAKEVSALQSYLGR